MSMLDRLFEVYRSGLINVGDTAEQGPSISCTWVKLKAASGNAGVVAVGWDENVIVPAGSDSGVAGWPLAAGEETGWIPLDNLNKFYFIAATDGDDISYMVLR